MIHRKDLITIVIFITSELLLCGLTNIDLSLKKMIFKSKSLDMLPYFLGAKILSSL